MRTRYKFEYRSLWSAYRRPFLSKLETTDERATNSETGEMRVAIYWL
jgi:hypothetical protein